MFEKVAHEKPAVILSRLKAMETEIDQELEEFEKKLAGVLK